MILFTGDDVAIKVTLRQPGMAYDVSGASSVEAAIVDDAQLLSPVVACNSEEAGADWASGVIMVVFTATQTAGLPDGTASIEVQVTDSGGKITTLRTSSTIVIRKGLIP